MYDPDYKMLFNQKVLPNELLLGKDIGEYAIHELDLFDRYLTADNIAFSNSMNESHMINIGTTPFKRKNSQLTMGKAQSQSNDGSNMNFEQASKQTPRSNLTEKKKMQKQ